jgi:hypothetical protein
MAPIIMFDVDGVLADFVQGFTTLAHDMFPEVPITLTVDQPKWDGFPGMTREQINKVWRVIDQADDFWPNLPALPIPAGDICDLQLRAQVYFVTNRKGQNVVEQTKRWLWRQGIEAPDVMAAGLKGEIARGLNANYMLDDKAGNVLHAYYHNLDRKAFKSYVLDRPYNQFDTTVVGSGVIRVKTIDDFISDINRDIAEGKWR